MSSRRAPTARRVPICLVRVDADLDHQFVAFLEQADFALDGKGQVQADFVMAVADLVKVYGASVRVTAAGLPCRRRGCAPDLPGARGPALRG